MFAAKVNYKTKHLELDIFVNHILVIQPVMPLELRHSGSGFFDQQSVSLNPGRDTRVLE